jgi:hypothetical protein
MLHLYGFFPVKHAVKESPFLGTLHGELSAHAEAAGDKVAAVELNVGAYRQRASEGGLE